MKFEIYQEKNGNWRWRLKTTNGRIIADSAEGYRKKTSCLRGVRLIKRSHGARIVEVD